MACYKIRTRFFIFAAIPVLIAACTSAQRFSEKDSSRPVETRYESGSGGSEKYSGKILLTLEGIASYYAHDFHGKKTSNGETYDMHAMTAAHRTFPFGTKVNVTNLENKKSVIVRINDRGPFKEGRIIDLSMGAAKKIDLVLNGTARVRLDVLEWGTGQ